MGSMQMVTEQSEADLFVNLGHDLSTEATVATDQGESSIENDGFCIKNDGFYVENDGFCIKNDGFYVENDGFCIKPGASTHSPPRRSRRGYVL